MHAEVERGRRLRECLPAVAAAVDWDERTFENEGQSLWKCLRVGILDAGKDPRVLDEIEDAAVNAAWEFILKIMERSPRSGRQVLECVAILSTSSSWLRGFARVSLPSRLALWRIAPGKRPSPADPAQVMHRLVSGLRAVGEKSPSWDDLLRPLDSVLANRHFLDQLVDCMSSDERAQFTTECRIGRFVVRGSSFSDDEVASEGAVEGASDGSPCVSGHRMAERPGVDVVSDKDIVQTLINSTVEAMEVASVCLDNYFQLDGISPQCDVNNIARQCLQDLRRLSARLDNLKARLLFFGPCQTGRTSLVAAMAGFPMEPVDTRTALTTEWHHSPSLAVPRITMPLQLNEHLQEWEASLMTSRLDEEDDPLLRVPLPCSAEGVEAVNALLQRVNGIVWAGREKGIITDQQARLLTHPEMALSIFTDFGHPAATTSDGDRPGELILVDASSPDGKLFDAGSMSQMLRVQAKQSNGMILVVDASRHPTAADFPSLINLLRSFQTDGCLRAEDLWIVGNCVDRLPDFHLPDDGRAACEAAVRSSLREVFAPVLAVESRMESDNEKCLVASARLASLGVYGQWKMHTLFGHGRKKSSDAINTTAMMELGKDTWFANIASVLYGIHWAASLRGMPLKAWDKEMRVLMSHGRVQGPVASSILGPACTAMMQRSVELTLHQLRAIIGDLTEEISAVSGGNVDDQQGADSHKLDQLRAVFATFLTDVENRVAAAFLELPGEEESCEEVIQGAMKSDELIRFEDVSSQPVLEYLRRVSEQAVEEWNGAYTVCANQAYKSTVTALEKWTRTVGHHLRRSRADGALRKRVAERLSSLHNRISDGPFECIPPENKWKDIILATVKKDVSVAKQQSLFNRAKVFELHRPAVDRFLRAFHALWSAQVKAESSTNFINPIKHNFEEICEVLRSPPSSLGGESPDGSTDFAFVPVLSRAFDKLKDFDLGMGDDGRDSMRLDKQRCEGLQAEVSEAVEAVKEMDCYHSKEPGGVIPSKSWFPWM
ncbi:hypothetical protein FOZ60_012064 [Perkinsus olseni]|uniref:Uncharacterized protein n=1 Tax=Perkinsus olseni TaxID=32597 RepID=A0A7J6NC65_PEROL|nr:hypothetical protein FOZ60_012064 [Perkinsus olseni]